VNKAKVQEERKQQITQLKNALAKIGRERETLKLEKEKYSSQVESLKGSTIDEKLKNKKELDHLRTELRKARVSQSKQAIANPSSMANQTDDTVALKLENDHLKTKIDKMASEAKEYENVKNGSGHAIDKLENTVSDLQLSLKDAENRDQQNNELIRQLRQELGQSREQITKLETKLETMIEAPKLESRRTSIAVPTPPPGIVEADIMGAITTHIYRVDLAS